MVSKSVIVHRFIALHRECLGFVQVNILGLPPSMLSLMEPTDLIDTRTKWHCFCHGFVVEVCTLCIKIIQLGHCAWLEAVRSPGKPSNKAVPSDATWGAKVGTVTYALHWAIDGLFFFPDGHSSNGHLRSTDLLGWTVSSSGAHLVGPVLDCVDCRSVQCFRQSQRLGELPDGPGGFLTSWSPPSAIAFGFRMFSGLSRFRGKVTTETLAVRLRRARQAYHSRAFRRSNCSLWTCEQIIINAAKVQVLWSKNYRLANGELRTLDFYYFLQLETEILSNMCLVPQLARLKTLLKLQDRVVPSQSIPPNALYVLIGLGFFGSL